MRLINRPIETLRPSAPVNSVAYSWIEHVRKLDPPPALPVSSEIVFGVTVLPDPIPTWYFHLADASTNGDRNEQLTPYVTAWPGSCQKA